MKHYDCKELVKRYGDIKIAMSNFENALSHITDTGSDTADQQLKDAAALKDTVEEKLAAYLPFDSELQEIEAAREAFNQVQIPSLEGLIASKFIEEDSETVIASLKALYEAGMGKHPKESIVVPRNVQLVFKLIHLFKQIRPSMKEKLDTYLSELTDLHPYMKHQ